MQRAETHLRLRAKCPLLLSDCIQNWNVSIVVEIGMCLLLKLEFIDFSQNWNVSILIEIGMCRLLSKLEFIDCYENSII
jgi:hypothetical protein